MSLFPSTPWGGSGFPGFGWSLIQSVTMEPVDTAPIGPAKALSPTDRAQAAPFAYGPYGWDTFGLGWGMGSGISYEPAPPSSPTLFWWMRKHPAVCIAMAASTLPIISGSRTYEIEDERGQSDLAKKMLEVANKKVLPVFNRSVEAALERKIFGNWLQELIFDRDDEDGEIIPVGTNSVLPLEARLFCDRQRKFSGFQIGEQYRDKRYAFNSVEQPHIHPVLGYSRCEAAKDNWWRSIQTNVSGDKAAIKQSGVHAMIAIAKNMPLTDERGNKITPQEYVQRLASIFASCTAFGVPAYAFDPESIKGKPELANIPAVKVDKFDWGDMGPFILSLIKRSDTCDKNIIRAFFHPERESTEGEHGTKAEAGVHNQSIGVLDCEATHASLCQQWDDGPTAAWVMARWGKRAPRLRLTPAPLADAQQEFLQGVTNTLFADRNTGPITQQYVDVPKLLERTEVPTRELSDGEKDKIRQQLATVGQTKQTAPGQPGTSNQPNNSANGDNVDVSSVAARVKNRINGNGRMVA